MAIIKGGLRVPRTQNSGFESMLFGVLFSLLTAISMDVGNLMEKRAVDRMVALSTRRAGQTLRTILTSRLWLAGFTICFVALGFQVVAFALAPIAVVQSIYGGGLVLLVVASRVYFGESIGRGELIGLGMIVFSLVIVSVSLGSGDVVGLSASNQTVVVAGVTTVLIVGVVFVLLAGRPNASALYGITSGFLYGAATLGTKGASTLVARYGILPSIPRILASPYPYLFLVASLLGLLVFQTGIQRGRIAVVAPLQSVVSSTYIVAVGMVIFHEPLPHNVVLSVLRVVGFIGVVCGSLLLAGLGEVGPGVAKA